jgi:hypothetical protein
MKKELKTLIPLVLFSLFAFRNIACFGKSDDDKSVISSGVKSLNSSEELKAYLDKQNANSPDKPIKVAIKANDMMLDKIIKVLDESGKYVNLNLSGSTIKFIRGLSGSKSLVGITIPDSVTSIDNGAFSNCTNLASITIPNSITSIGDNTFYNCTSIAIINIPDSITKIGINTFSNCTSLTSITLPGSVNSIGYAAFYHCIKLTSITLPNSITSIAKVTFMDCWNLTSVTIPNSVTSIGMGAFGNCVDLSSITIGNGVTSIESWAFYDCNKLISVTFHGTIPSSGFNNKYPFMGDLRDKFYATDASNGTPGTYTRAIGSETWTRK